ncbi:MFS transporter [Tamlana sp. 2_MG-2023]|uniref:MFS transporter n=1 Tax=unclassified Tamlana TaxID=2614803 RepID=UPI0026E472F4|nr:MULTISPECIES: MFS transporter [unclassified Tamlana]MDO6758937.1 MFS transporter [Tamlana sp. 2_MG-2023]MDO6789636.1 MFS transporter [Tamlana sp. 1_MG-2023]
MNHSKVILPTIVFSQFCCTSLWFAGNGVITDLISTFNLEPSALGLLTSAVQFGFIIGTFLFAFFTITDRFSPSKVFFVSALLGAFFNGLVVLKGHSIHTLVVLRFLTGFFLAGIYPVGMKIAADYYQKGLGKSLGFLVGALVIGTAFPHLLKGFSHFIAWQNIVYITSALALLGGVLILVFVPDGPFRKSAKAIDLSVLFKIFRNGDFRSAAFGYFGHMWELYAFWAFVPLLLTTYVKTHPNAGFNISVLSFCIIALGGIACVISGYLSEKFQTKRVALVALILSGICCLVSPLFFQITSEVIFIAIIAFWGMVVIADSPLFSTLIAQTVNPEFKGTALTIVNCIGYCITIVSIMLLNNLSSYVSMEYIFVILAIGPLLGVAALLKKREV